MRLLSIILLFLVAQLAQSQQFSVTAEVDSMTIAVGEQTQLTITAIFPEEANATLRTLQDTVTKNIEVLEKISSDTIIQNNLRTYIDKYTITSFDTGLHYVPPVQMLYLPDNQTISTQPFALNVLNPFINMEVDEASGVNKITDIKPALDAPFSLLELLEYWPYFLAALVLVGAIIGAIYLYKYSQKKDKGLIKPKNLEPADVVAMRELLRIKDEKLWQQNRTKEYYSELTDVLRKYISERYNINALESTTDEIIGDIFQYLEGDINNKNRLQEILELADFVKFAKAQPLENENDMAMKKSIDFVKETAVVVEKKEEVVDHE